MDMPERLSRIVDLLADTKVSDYPHSRLARFAVELFEEIIAWKRGDYPYGKQVVGVHHEPEADHDRPPGSQRP